MELTIRDRMRVMCQKYQDKYQKYLGFMFQMYPMFQKYLFLYKMNLDGGRKIKMARKGVKRAYFKGFVIRYPISYFKLKFNL